MLTTLLPFRIATDSGAAAWNSYLSKTTLPITVTHVYRAGLSDVSERGAAIERWDSDRNGTQPAPLVVGQSFEKTYILPPRSVFWNDGLKVDGRRLVGQGFLKVDLVLIDLAGWDLSHNSYSLNETITMLVRIVIPIGVLIVVSLLTPADATDRLDQFFGKMRTKVLTDPTEDSEAMELTRAMPGAIRSSQIISQFELAVSKMGWRRFTRSDRKFTRGWWMRCSVGFVDTTGVVSECTTACLSQKIVSVGVIICIPLRRFVGKGRGKRATWPSKKAKLV